MTPNITFDPNVKMAMLVGVDTSHVFASMFDLVEAISADTTSHYITPVQKEQGNFLAMKVYKSKADYLTSISSPSLGIIVHKDLYAEWQDQCFTVNKPDNG